MCIGTIALIVSYIVAELLLACFVGRFIRVGMGGDQA